MQLHIILDSLGLSWSAFGACWLDHGTVISRDELITRLIAAGYPVVVTGYAALLKDIATLEAADVD